MSTPGNDEKPAEKPPAVGAEAKPDFEHSESGSISPRTLIIGGLAVVFGISAVIALREFMKHESGPSTKVSVLMTAEDIPRGITITPEYVTTKEYPKEDVPEGALTNPAQGMDRVVEVPMIKGEPILDGKLAPKGSGRGLAAIVKPGMRAMTIQTTNVASGVAGLIMPGDLVDVLMTMNDPGGGNDTTGGGSTKTLLTKIEVLAVDQRVNEPTNGKVDPKEMRSVTLLVKPEQANMLDLGQNKGILHLTLRNPGDPDVTKAKTETLNDFRFGPNGQAKVATVAPIVVPSSTMKTQEIHSYVRIRTIRGASEGYIDLEETPVPYRAHR
jgi:pilus assembly protein CpaB